jgi:hypothetical protein
MKGPITRICEALGCVHPWKSRPAGFEEMIEFVWKKNVDCACDECKPELYNESNNSSPYCPPEHARIVLKTEPNYLGFQAYKPLGPQLASHKEQYETMHLVRSVVKYMDVPLAMMNTEQVEGRAEFKELWPKLENKEQLSLEELRLLFSCCNKMFFGGDMPCKIKDLDLEHVPTYGEAGRDADGNSYIALDLKGIKERCDGSYDAEHPAWELLAILLHESVHAFLTLYACIQCNSCETCTEPFRYHGRSFQIIARKIEEVFKRELDIPMDLRRGPSIFANWNRSMSKNPPSRHDMHETFGFVYLALGWEKTYVPLDDIDDY